MFTIVEAFAIGKTELASVWPNIGEGILKADEEHAKMDRKDRMKEEIAMMLVQCGAHVNLMPCYWNRGELGALQEKKDWKEWLITETEVKKDGQTHR